jgi:thiamine transporter
MKKNRFDVITLVEISICAAIGFILDLIAGVLSDFMPTFANGGSIGIAMVAVLIISVRRGPLAGFLTGLIMGGLDLLKGNAYFIHSSWINNLLQVLLDYIISYALVCVSGFVRPLLNDNKKNNAIKLGLFAALGGFLKFLSHFFAGIMFWPQNPNAKMFTSVTIDGTTYKPTFIYSLLYNGGYMLPSIVLSIIVFVVIYLVQPKIIQPSLVEVTNNEEQ